MACDLPVVERLGEAVGLCTGVQLCVKEQSVMTTSIPETQRNGHRGGMCDLRAGRVVLITEP